MSARVDREPGGRGEVGVLLQSDCLVKVVLWGTGAASRPQQPAYVSRGTTTRTYLANIFICFILRERSLALIVAEQPQARCAVKVIVGNVEVVGACLEYGVLLWLAG